MTTIELARFTIHPGAEEALLTGRSAMLAALRARFPACVAAYLTREDDGSYLDLIIWRDRAAAEEAARQITTVPEAVAWFQHIADSGGVRHAEVLDVWPALPT